MVHIRKIFKKKKKKKSVLEVPKQETAFHSLLPL